MSAHNEPEWVLTMRRNTQPNLKRFQAIGFGKGIKSERPVIFEIAVDPEKQKASDRLTKKWEEQAVVSVAGNDQTSEEGSGNEELAEEATPWEDDDNDAPF